MILFCCICCLSKYNKSITGFYAVQGLSLEQELAFSPFKKMEYQFLEFYAMQLQCQTNEFFFFGALSSYQHLYSIVCSCVNPWRKVFSQRWKEINGTIGSHICDGIEHCKHLEDERNCLMRSYPRNFYFLMP